MVSNNSHRTVPEIWAGIECSYNRVGDTYLDQLALSGHDERADDIERFAQLGIKALHYPLLWERHPSPHLSSPEWDRTASQVDKLRSHAIVPVVGLLHHGSGPAFTQLTDDNFATGLSAFAKEVATRFPWLTYYKPVNEPLTTARFSGLYGLWHPHAKDDAVFANILLNQLKAVVLSMQEIRKVNPDAKLIQTEDLGKTYSTPTLQYQADFENHRRWLTYDMLTGRFDRHHPLWDYFRGLGIPAKTLLFFREQPCPPDLLGVNHYVTSERFLDDDLAHYPAHLHGGNGRHAYVDVEAIRVDHGQSSGLKVLLQELRERYPIDIALTEVHLHCTREEQLRWLKYVLDTCTELNKEKPTIKSLTVWSLLGAYGWDTLLTRPGGAYESGIFDLRSPEPRPTALATFVKALTQGRPFHHPVLQQPGWWQKESRFIYDSAQSAAPVSHFRSSPPLLIIGKNGTLGRAFGLICQQRGILCRLLSRREMDLCQNTSIEEMLRLYRPWAVVNAAGYADIDSAENDSRQCFNDNVTGVKNLADGCRKHGVKLLTFSSAMVFDGTKNSPYLESDGVAPLNAFGRSKAEAETLVLEADKRALVIRTGFFLNPWDPSDFISQLLTNVSAPQLLFSPEAMMVSPTYLPDLVHMALDLLIDDECGLWHLTNQGEMSWATLAGEAAQRGGHSPPLMADRFSGRTAWNAPRPQYCVLGSERGSFLPPLHHALDRYFNSKRNYAETIG